MYITNDKKAVPSRRTLLRNKRLVLLNNSAIWQPDEFSTLTKRTFAILEDSDQKALPQFDARADSCRNQELSVTIGQNYSDVGKGKIVTVLDGKCPVPLSFDGNRFHPNSNAIHIVTGGVKGFGMATVKWVFSKGVKHVAIIGRSEAEERHRGPGRSRLSHLHVQPVNTALRHLLVDRWTGRQCDSGQLLCV